MVDLENRVARDIRFYLLSQYYWWRAFLVYREQAAMWMIYSFFSVLYSYITISVIYNVSAGIAGWSYYQMLFLVSTSTMLLSITYYNVNIWWVMNLLRQGGMDPYLVRPYGRLTTFLAAQEGLGSSSAIIGALVLMLYAASNMSVSPAALLAFLVLVVAGAMALIIFTLMVIMLVYHLLRSANLVERLMNFVQQASQYPLGVYGPMGLLIFTLILPVGIASYYPARAFLSGTSPFSFLESLFIAVAIGAVSYVLFNWLQRYYTSGGG